MSEHRTRVAIIGGGIAGMSAALSLSQHSDVLRITLFESKRYTGGRAGSFVDSETGQQVDYCQHVGMGCCTNLIEMMRDAGIVEPFVRHEQLFFHHPKHPVSRFWKARFLPAPFHLAPSLLGLHYLSWRQRLEISRATMALMQCTSQSLRTITARDWLIAKGQSSKTIADYWDVVIASALGDSCERVSMAAARKVFVDGFLSCREASDVLVPRLPLAELFGNVLRKSLTDRGVEVRTSTKVRSVETSNIGAMNVELEDATETFDHAILAVPFFAIAKVLSEQTAVAAGLPADRFSNVPCSPISGIHLWFDRSIMDRPHAVMVGTLAQWLFDRHEDHGETQDHYVQVVVSASHDLRKLDAEKVIAQVVEEIRAVLPRAREATCIRGRVVTDPFSVYSLSPEVDAIRPSASTALPCLHLAGDFVQTGWPATMEGAVISGKMAASSVLSKVGGNAVRIHSGLKRSPLARLLIKSS